jgi:hypothetical protein
MTRNLPALISICTAWLGLAGCDELTRFEQEKYECGPNPTGIYELDFRSTKVRDKVTMVTATGDNNATIVFADKNEFVLEESDLIIRINRQTGLIRSTKGNRYSEFQCTKTNFRM